MNDIFWTLKNCTGSIIINALEQIDINTIDSYGDSLLMAACAYWKTDIVREILKKPDININYVNEKTKKSALTLAYWNRNLSGNLSDNTREIFYCILGHSKIDITKNLFSHAYDSNILYLSIAIHDYDIINFILKMYPDKDIINQKSILGETSLTLACQMGQQDIVKKLLLIPGVDVNVRDNDNFGILILMTEYFVNRMKEYEGYENVSHHKVLHDSYCEIIQLLIDYDIDIYTEQELLFERLYVYHNNIPMLIKDRMFKDMCFLQIYLPNDLVREIIYKYIV